MNSQSEQIEDSDEKDIVQIKYVQPEKEKKTQEKLSMEQFTQLDDRIKQLVIEPIDPLTIPNSQLLSLTELMSLKRKITQNQNITFDITETKYPILRHLGAEIFNWSINSNNNSSTKPSQSFIIWHDTYTTEDYLRKMNVYQQINRFPGSYILGKKNCLAQNLMKMYNRSPQEYQFFPQTWILPQNLQELQRYHLKCKAKQKQKKIYIVKPESMSQGKGIYIINQIDSNLDNEEHMVVQQYITNPLLIDGLQFDLRIYALVRSVSPLKIFIYREGLARLATLQYMVPNQQNFNDRFMHLTNYAINKKNPDFVQNQSQFQDNIGHKRSFSSVLKYLEEQGQNTTELMLEIRKIINQTLCSAQPFLSHLYRANQSKEQHNQMCFQIFGFDILLDENLKPWLLEVNHTPSFTADTPLDYQIKKHLLMDTLILIDPKSREQIKDQKAQPGKRSSQSQQKLQEHRILKDEQNQNGFIQSYPSEDDPTDYQKLMEIAQQMHDEFTYSKQTVTASESTQADSNIGAAQVVENLNGSTQQIQSQRNEKTDNDGINRGFNNSVEIGGLSTLRSNTISPFKSETQRQPPIPLIKNQKSNLQQQYYPNILDPYLTISVSSRTANHYSPTPTEKIKRGKDPTVGDFLIPNFNFIQEKNNQRCVSQESFLNSKILLNDKMDKNSSYNFGVGTNLSAQNSSNTKSTVPNTPLLSDTQITISEGGYLKLVQIHNKPQNEQDGIIKNNFTIGINVVNDQPAKNERIPQFLQNFLESNTSLKNHADISIISEDPPPLKFQKLENFVNQSNQLFLPSNLLANQKVEVIINPKSISNCSNINNSNLNNAHLNNISSNTINNSNITSVNSNTNGFNSIGKNSALTSRFQSNASNQFEKNGHSHNYQQIQSENQDMNSTTQNGKLSMIRQLKYPISALMGSNINNSTFCQSQGSDVSEFNQTKHFKSQNSAIHDYSQGQLLKKKSKSSQSNIIELFQEGIDENDGVVGTKNDYKILNNYNFINSQQNSRQMKFRNNQQTQFAHSQYEHQHQDSGKALNAINFSNDLHTKINEIQVIHNQSAIDEIKSTKNQQTKLNKLDHQSIEYSNNAGSSSGGGDPIINIRTNNSSNNTNSQNHNINSIYDDQQVRENSATKFTLRKEYFSSDNKQKLSENFKHGLGPVQKIFSIFDSNKIKPVFDYIKTNQ